MDERAVLFIEVMIAIAIVAVLTFIVSLIARTSRPQEATADGPVAGPQWYVFVLAIVLLLVVAALLIWELSPSANSQLARTGIADDNRSLIFFIVMLVMGGIAVAGFLIYAFTQIRHRPRNTVTEGPESAETAAGAAAMPIATSTGGNLLGLFILALGFLLLNWIYVPAAQQYALVLYLLYPASIAVSLVLLFDKATRAWSAHGSSEPLREWLFCDLIVFLLILGFLNLLQSEGSDKYAGVLWDVINVVLFFFIFWIVDRTAIRIRFLIAYAYIIGLPILLLIWRAVQQVELPETLGWWNSIWPFFYLALIFAVLEIISLVATRDSDTRSAVPAVKDFLFVAAYTVLLIVSVPAEG